MKIFTPKDLKYSVWNGGEYNVSTLLLSDIIGANEEVPCIFIDELSNAIKCFNCEFRICCTGDKDKK